MIFQYTLDKVLNGTKTQTTRLAKPRQKRRFHVGQTLAVQPSRNEKGVARIAVKSVKKERLGATTDAGARAEGFRDLDAFKREWTHIHGKWDSGQWVWVIGFALIERS